MRKMILFAITILVLANSMNVFVQAQCVQPPSNQVAWFPFDENSGTTTKNQSEPSKNGTLSGPTWSPGKVSNSLNFNISFVNVNDYPTINFGIGDFSIEGWISLPNAAAGSGIKTIVDKRHGNTMNTMLGYLLFIYNGKLALQLMTQPEKNMQYYSTTAIPIGSWAHIAITVDRDNPTGIKFYINGVPAGTANPMNRPGNLTNLSPLRIGRQAGSYGFIGGIDELGIFNRVLTPAEITSIFTADNAGKCKTASPPSPPQPMVSVSNNIVQNIPASTILPPSTDVYFVFEHPLAKWIIVAGHDTANFKNVVKRIEPNGTVTNIPLPKCKGMYNPPSPAELQMFVRSVTWGGDLIVTGQFDRCELMPNDPFPLGTQGIVKVKANGQIDHNFVPDFFPANSPACQTVGTQPYTRKYCQYPMNFEAIQAIDGGLGFSSIYLYGNFQNINGTSLPNPTNLIKLNVNTGQHDTTFTAPNISGTVKGIGANANNTNFAVWGNFTVGSTRKNYMILNPNGSIYTSNIPQHNPGTNIDGTINTVGTEPIPITFMAGGDFTKFKASNYPLGSQLPIKNIVFTNQDFNPNTNGYSYFSWGSITPFEIISMARATTGNGGICAGGNNNSLVCFTPSYQHPFSSNNVAPTATSVSIGGNVKVVFNIFNTSDFLVGGSFGLVKVTFTP